jgi:hypothetical protein
MIDHIVLAVLIQLVVRFISGSWIAGAAAACAWFISRELAQAEYRWIEQFGAGLRANMPWWGGFDLRVWPKADQWLDWIVPSAVSLGLAFLAQRRVKSATSS